MNDGFSTKACYMMLHVCFLEGQPYHPFFWGDPNETSDFTLWLFNSSPWYRWFFNIAMEAMALIEIDGLPGLPFYS